MGGSTSIKLEARPIRVVQKENAAVAKRVIESLKNFGWSISKEQIQEGLSLAKWPGRLQTTKWRGMPIVVDGAHILMRLINYQWKETHGLTKKVESLGY